MFELIKESFAIYHLPVTTLLGITMLFWFGVILGGLDIDVFDFDLDADVDIDLDVDASDLELEGASSSLGLFAGLVKFVNADAVPTMVVATFMGIFMWAIALLSNVAFNPGEPFERSYAIALGLLIPNFIASAFLTKMVTWPLIGFFEKLNYSGEKHVPVVGRSGVVKTSEVNTDFGQVEIEAEGASVIIQARVSAGTIPKGTPVLVVDRDNENDTYTVRPVDA